MSQELLIRLAGLHSLGFALFHLAFWKLFDWKRDLRSTSPATRAVAQILNLRLVYLFLGVAAACLFLTGELLHTRLGRFVLGFMALFWVGRTLEQFVFLRVNRPLVHALTALFVVGAALFAAPLLAGRG